MTIEKLLALLQPYYREWNEDRESMYLIAVRPHTTLSVSMLQPDEEASVYEPNIWRLGMSTQRNSKEPPVHIADVRVLVNEVTGIVPAIGTSLGHVMPLINAAFNEEELKELLIQ